MSKSTLPPVSPRNRKSNAISIEYRVKPFSGHLWALLHHYEIITAGEMAELFNRSVKTIYAMSEGKFSMKPEQILLLFQTTGRAEVLDYFIKGSEYILVKRPEFRGKIEQDILIHNLSVSAGVGKIHRDLDIFLEDNVLSRREKDKLAKDIDIAEAQLEAMRMRLEE